MTGGNAGHVVVWDLATGQALIDLDAHDYVIDVQWSPDGTKLASVGYYDGPLIVWDTADLPSADDIPALTPPVE